MQTMPTKNRTSVAVIGVVLLMVVVGLIAWGVRNRDTQPEPDTLSQVAAPENGTAAVQANPAGNALGAAAESAPATNQAAGQADARVASAPTTPVTAQPATAEPTAASTPALSLMAPVPATHVVEAGETLYGISMKYYQSHIYAGDIEKLNGLSNPNMIQTGMTLNLPRPEDLVGYGE